MKKIIFITAASFMALFLVTIFSSSVQGTLYGTGTYGSCQYESCTISLTSNSTVAVNVSPSGSSPTCSVASDTVGVTTGSSTGYTLSFKNTTASSQMTGSHGGIINPVSGTPTSPVVLSANTWGYRVDGLSSFGSGPTTSRTNSSVPTFTFAAVPASGGTAAILKTVSGAITSPDPTVVWYGLCINTTIPAGTFSSSVTYTAIVN